MPIRVLVLSASMGAGHEGAAVELQRRLRLAGHHATVVDFLDFVPTAVARAWRASYRLQVRHLPAAYERSYRLYYSPSRSWDAVLRFATWLTGRGLRRAVSAERPDVLVSTYPFATLVLGEQRAAKVIERPVVNFVTDLGVHPRVVHEAVDLNLVPHEVSARAAQALVDVPTVATGPVVSPAFVPPTAERRAAARGRLGISTGEVVVVVVAGSLGFGQVRETVDALLATGRLCVVVACGGDERLRSDLTRKHGRVLPLGWTDDVAGLYAAADVVVENAGGLSAFEAMATGVPVITYAPIPGHGRDNAAAMAEAGITEQPECAAALIAAIDRLAVPGPDRDRRTAAASALFAADPVPLIVGAVGA